MKKTLLWSILLEVTSLAIIETEIFMVNSFISIIEKPLREMSRPQEKQKQRRRELRRGA